jgi:hypothetical protein
MARIYTYLGLLDEGQTIENYFQNLGVESFGGMYAPEIDQVLIVGLTFGEKEQYVYVNEYVAYLADQEFDQEKVGLNSVCSEDMQACAALHALISGHAGMIAEDWLNAYASSETQDEIEAQLTNYKLFPQASDAGFINADLSFYREMGADFVAAISKNFGVAGIWDAYLAPPTTTEQILHPEKYLEIEEAIIVDDVEIFSEFESDGWQIARNDSLGEWLTYLILTENSSELAQLTQDDAADAAAGWGGDQYYFFKHPNSGDTVIAVHWVFDDEEELEEFYTFFAFYIAGRFSDGFPDIEPEADCYGKDRVACFAVNEAANELIWIMGDEEADIDTLINHYLATFP